MNKYRSVCPYCGCGCTLYLVTEGQRVIGVEPGPGSPVNRGMLCAKGWSAHEFVHAPDRLTAPLVRKGGTLVETDWEEALDTAAGGLSRIRETSGPGALGFLSSAKVTNEENYLFMKMARAAFSTNNIDHCARL